MTDNCIYTRQMAILMFLSSTVMKLSSLPSLWAMDISTSVFLAMILMCVIEIVIFCLIYSFVQSDGVTMLDRSKAKYPVCMGLYLYFFAKLFVLIAFMANFISNFLFDSISLYIVVITIIIPIVFLAVKGMRSIARSGEFFVLFTALCYFLLLAFLDSDFDFGRLKPMLAVDSMTMFKSGFAYGIWFGDALPFIFVTLKKSKKAVLPITIGLSYTLICIVTMLSVAIFGDALPIADNLLVNLSMFNQLSSVLGRLQWISIVPWLIGSCVECGMLFWAMSEAGMRIVNKKNLVVAFSAIALTVPYVAMKRYDVIIENASGVLGYVMFGLMILIPVLLLIILAVRRRKNAEAV
ncbi:MAG: GerAB/ArcD/ProY family transporter [Christensenellales bacterium]